MKAIVNHEYGSPDVLILEKVEKPTPKDNKVLIKVHAASVNTGEWYFLTGKPFIVRLNPGGLLKLKTKILGGDVAGRLISRPISCIGCDRYLNQRVTNTC